ncbi:MAG: leucine-rich repeat protein [Paludibacteraceae bacterium]|nr:leucine-rich repeat protein [Paludibacteraceae bacterium]
MNTTEKFTISVEDGEYVIKGSFDFGYIGTYKGAQIQMGDEVWELVEDTIGEDCSDEELGAFLTQYFNDFAERIAKNIHIINGMFLLRLFRNMEKRELDLREMEDLYLADQDPYDETVDIYEAVKDKVKEFEKNIRIPQSDSNEEVLTANDFKAIFPMFDFDKFLENIVPVTLTFDNGTIAFHCAETFGITLSHHSYDVLNEELRFTKWESAIGKLSFEITSETTCKVVKYEGWVTETKVPEEVTIDGKKYKVTAVGENAFNCSNAQKVELPSGITEIEDSAFMGSTYLEQINLPDGLKVMGDSVFNYCKWIRNIEIPDSVESLGAAAFYGCEKLSRVKLPTELTEIYGGTFYECKSLESIEIPDTVKSIGDYAFYECEKLTTVDLPSVLLSLGEGAFKSCLALEHIELPQSLTQLGDMALANCPLLGEVVLPPGIALEEVNYGFEEDSSKEVVDEPESCTESEFQYSKNDKMIMNSVKVEEEIINIWSYRGELVKLYPNKIVIGKKKFPADSKKSYCCENGVLTCEDDDNFYVYNGEEFVHTECKYRNHNDYFSSDIFCSTMIDRREDVQCVALTDHGEETSFKFKFRCSFSEYHYFAKTGVLLFVETFYPKLRFFSKDGEELWYLEQVADDGIRDSFSYVVDTLNMDFDGDGIIIKIQKGEQCYTVCYHVGSGEVLWYRKDNHPFLFAGAKCEDGLMRGVFPYYDDGEYCTVMFEINPSNGKASTYRISDSEKAKAVTVEGFKTRSVQYKYILDGEILYAIGTDEIIVVDTQKKVLISRKKAPENVPYRQEDAVLCEGKLYVCLMFDGGFLPVWKCYELADAKVVEKKAKAPAAKKSGKKKDKSGLVLSGKKTFTHDNFNELDDMDKLQVLTGCECKEFDGSVNTYFKYREQGKKEGFIPVIVATDDIYFEQLDALLKCGGEGSISKIQKIVEKYHKKMLAEPVEDGKAYLEKNHISGEWDDDVDLDGEDYEASDAFTRNGYLVRVPVTEPWRIWAYLPYGGWNACPKVSEHMAVSKYWYEQYGAYPAAFSFNTIDYAVEVPPEDLEKLANEVGTYCFDIVEQGCETYSALAAGLKNSRIWNFWWD